MSCEDCFLQMFKIENLDFKEELYELRVRLDVLFIKHFGQEIMKITEKDEHCISKLIQRLDVRSQMECSGLTGMLGGQQLQQQARAMQGQHDRISGLYQQQCFLPSPLSELVGNAIGS